MIGICDDIEKDRKKLQVLCEEFLADKEIQYAFVLFSSGEEVISYTGERIHVLFLDVEMEKTDGIQVIRALENSNLVWRVVFVSSHPEAVFEAFGIKTLGFERKPIEYDKIEKWLQVVLREHQDNFLIECNGVDGRQWVEIEDLYYLEAQRNYVNIHTKEEVIFSSGNLSIWEKKLKETFVIRVHKTYLVNLMYIKAIGKEITLKNGIKIPIGRQYKAGVTEKYHEYICKMAERRI